MNSTLYIINPAVHGGAGATAWAAFQKSWPDPIDPVHVISTERPGHAREIAAGNVYRLPGHVSGFDSQTPWRWKPD